MVVSECLNGRFMIFFGEYGVAWQVGLEGFAMGEQFSLEKCHKAKVRY